MLNIALFLLIVFVAVAIISTVAMAIAYMIMEEDKGDIYFKEKIYRDGANSEYYTD